MKQRILIVTPYLKSKGGVSSYYRVLLQELFGQDTFEIRHLQVGSYHLMYENNNVLKIFILFYDLLRALGIFLFRRTDLVIVNPSLDFKSIIRDGLILRIGKLFGSRFVVFFRGWMKDASYEERYKKALGKTLFKADAFIVLAESFKEKLEEWGVTQPVYTETTSVDKKLLSGFDIRHKLETVKSAEEIRFLFLGRVEKAKGIQEMLTAFHQLVKQGKPISLTIVGTGNYEKETIQYIRDNALKSHFHYKGYQEGEAKRAELEKAHVYCLASYSEGMPNSVLEAMSFGMPVIATPVGGLRDFFEDGRMGFFVPIGSSEDIYRKALYFLDNREQIIETGMYNYTYSTGRFRSDVVSGRILKICGEVLNHSNYQTSNGLIL